MWTILTNLCYQFFCHSKQRWKEIRLACDHYRKSRGEDKVFEEGKNQLSGSKVQSEHRQDNTNIDNPTSSGAKRKGTSIRVILQSQCCPYSFVIHFVRKNNLPVKNGVFQDYINDKYAHSLCLNVKCNYIALEIGSGQKLLMCMIFITIVR